MANKALEAFSELGDDEELGPADWPTVKRYISCLNDFEGEHVHPHGASESDGDLDPMNSKDIRVRLLDGMQTSGGDLDPMNSKDIRVRLLDGMQTSGGDLDPMNLKDMRVRLLNGMQTFTFVSIPRDFTFIVFFFLI